MIREYKKAIVVAEIGCNHKGDFAIAKEMIELAHSSGADYAKFQKRNPKELLSQEQYDAPHQVPYNAYGDSYGAHREFLELDLDQHKALKEHCESIGISYACSVWDLSSAEEIVSLDPDYIKIPSACNNNTELLGYLRDNYTGPIHISLGMTTDEEEARIRRVNKVNAMANKVFSKLEQDEEEAQEFLKNIYDPEVITEVNKKLYMKMYEDS